MKGVTYSGYTASEAGVSRWPSRRLIRRWQDLVAIETVVRADVRRCHATLRFANGPALSLRGAPVWSSSMRRFAEFLALAEAGAPETAAIDEATREIACWGGREAERRILRTEGLAPSVKQWLERARFHRTRLGHGAALRATERALAAQPGGREALELRQALLEEAGAGLKKIVAAAEQCAAHFPEDAGFRTRLYALKLQANDARIVPEAEALFEREPDNFLLGFALAEYFFRHAHHERAVAVTDRLSQRPGAAEWRQQARASRDYVQRNATSGRLRAKERLNRWRTAAAVVAVFGLFGGTAVWQARRQPNPKPERRAATVAVSAEEQARANQAAAEIAKAKRGLAETFIALKKRADAGDAPSQYAVAQALFAGRMGAARNAREAQHYLELAVAQNHAEATAELAERLGDGADVTADAARALSLLRKAEELGSPRATVLLGKRYRDGNGVEKDDAKAFALFQKSAAAGYPSGHAMLAWAFETGTGIAQDVPAAIEIYRHAAGKNDQSAQEQLVRIFYDQNQPYFDAVEARKWMWVGARQGSALLRAGVLEQLLIGAPATSKETNEALAWLADDVAKGEAFALFASGQAAWQGWHRPRNWTEAVRFFKKAAEKDYPPAVHRYARCLAGGVGVPQDLAKARRWREKLVALQVPEEAVKNLDEVIAAMTQPLPAPLAEGEHRPKPIAQEGPQYPWKMAQANLNGEVVVEFIIGQDGRTRELHVVSSDFREFEVPALTAVAFWRFVPGSKEGRRINVRVSQKVEFNLENESAPAVKAVR